MSHLSKNKKIYLINRDFQLRYMKMAVMVGFVSTLMTISLLLFPLQYFGIIRLPGFLPPMFMWAIGIAAGLNFLMVASGSILITHRIAGPMFSLVRQFRVIQSGFWHCPLSVRRDDEMKYVFRNFNELTEYLDTTCTDDLTDLDDLEVMIKNKSAIDETLQKISSMKQNIAARNSKETIG